MKKWTRLLALVALVAVILLVTPAVLAEECQHDGPWHYAWIDETGHWKVCELCYTALPEEEHTIGYRQNGSDNPQNHWNECSICGYSGLAAHDSYVYVDEQTHVISCSLCGYDGGEQVHRADCTNKTVCVDCGGACTDAELVHPRAKITTDHDDVKHWNTCEACGELTWSSEHYMFCDNRGVCDYCDAPYTGENVRHVDVVIDFDRREHWEVCTNCDEIVWGPDEHYVRDGSCSFCGWEGDMIYPNDPDDCEHANTSYHDYYEDYRNGLIDFDTAFDLRVCHKLVCDDCGTVLAEKEEHAYGAYFPSVNGCTKACEKCDYAESRSHEPSCDGGECHACGFDCTDIMDQFESNRLWHDHQTSTRIDDETHRRFCPCGTVDVIENHVADRNNPSVCKDCGAKLSDDEEEIVTPAPRPTEARTPRPTAAATPAPTATATPEPTQEPETTETPKREIPTLDNETGKLAIVDEDGEIVDYTGFETFEGADFYFEDGVIRDDMNGLTLIGGTWHNMDHGRFNTSDGIVFFEGGAFMVKDGLIDGAQDGLIEYNGEWFVFSNGQFQPQVYGAWPDHRSGKFVYIWGGQFYPITDLVSYDGQVFYFINGYLATDFTGIVKDFQGTEFNIINGQAY